MNTHSLSGLRFYEDLVIGKRYVLPAERVEIIQRWQEMGCYYLTLKTQAEDLAQQFDVAVNNLLKTGQANYLADRTGSD